MRLAQLQDEFEIEEQIFEIDGPLDITYFMKLANTLNGYDNLRYPRIVAKYPLEFEDTAIGDFFNILRMKDVLVHHPYETFDAVTDFIVHAAYDPQVLAIKMTLIQGKW